MAEALDAFAVDVDIVVAPQGLEFGAEPAQLVDELADFGDGAGARRIRPERADHKTRHASQSYCAARTRGSPKMRRRMLRWPGGSAP